MSYDISLKVKVEGLDMYIKCADGGNITWNVRELIYQSSRWEIKNCQNNGLAEEIGKLIEQGIERLENSPTVYKQYESKNEWGTIEGTLNFYKYLLAACKEYPFAYVFVH